MPTTKTETRWGFVYTPNLPLINAVQLANPGATKEEALDVCDSNETVVKVTIVWDADTRQEGAR